MKVHYWVNYLFILLLLSACAAGIPNFPQTDHLTDYTLPDKINPDARYLFYLHGKVIEYQGLPAVSTELVVFSSQIEYNACSSI